MQKYKLKLAKWFYAILFYIYIYIFLWRAFDCQRPKNKPDFVSYDTHLGKKKKKRQITSNVALEKKKKKRRKTRYHDKQKSRYHKNKVFLTKTRKKDPPVASKINAVTPSAHKKKTQKTNN